MRRGGYVGLALTLVVGATSPTWGAALQVRVPGEPVPQGELRSLRVLATEPLTRLDARFRGLPLPARPEAGGYTVLLAVDLETPPGAYPVEFEADGASGQRYQLRRRVTVADARFPVQRLTLPKEWVDLDPETLERVRSEEAALAAIWDGETAGPYWWTGFAPPLDGDLQVSSAFGLRRIINGQPRSPHGGVDFHAPAGTPVRASNGGVVAFAADLFFSGKSVIVHHGGGLFTMYFHLEAYRVEAGHEVAKGDILGWVGATGRATGPHLHWGARLQRARVNPERLLQLAPP